MDIGNLFDLGAKVFIGVEEGGVKHIPDSAAVIAALGLLGDNDSFSISRVADAMRKQGMGNILASWMAGHEISESEKLSISSEQVIVLFGHNRLVQFSEKLGVSKSEAIFAIKKALPRIVENANAANGIPDTVRIAHSRQSR